MDTQKHLEHNRKEGNMETMGDIIHRLRRGRGMTMEELAVYSRTSTSTISLLESGKRKASARTVQNIADALGVGPGDLYPLDPAPTPRDSGDLEGHSDTGEAEREFIPTFGGFGISVGNSKPPREEPLHLDEVKGTLLHAILEDVRDGRIDVDEAGSTIMRLTKI